ncbi:hypothetical protein J8273_1237 [Carpediemonas membranifera]|uniref:Uncharacterized protein n=1 Tax=Carpediemonas membranifera TaxID=201153 RepID=A0A8J6BCF8_9EUKA|nr:hypothetical protein J8273_1237 [Carpediemonas membranifera]|eukprot:KAG9397322.1 hypothetical protein J8273_1237 [Carpediemonas membranifera]
MNTANRHSLDRTDSHDSLIAKLHAIAEKVTTLSVRSCGICTFTDWPRLPNLLAIDLKDNSISDVSDIEILLGLAPRLLRIFVGDNLLHRHQFQGTSLLNGQRQPVSINYESASRASSPAPSRPPSEAPSRSTVCGPSAARLTAPQPQPHRAPSPPHFPAPAVPLPSLHQPEPEVPSTVARVDSEMSERGEHSFANSARQALQTALNYELHKENASLRRILDAPASDDPNQSLEFAVLAPDGRISQRARPRDMTPNQLISIIVEYRRELKRHIVAAGEDQRRYRRELSELREGKKKLTERVAELQMSEMRAQGDLRKGRVELDRIGRGLVAAQTAAKTRAGSLAAAMEKLVKDVAAKQEAQVRRIEAAMEQLSVGRAAVQAQTRARVKAGHENEELSRRTRASAKTIALLKDRVDQLVREVQDKDEALTEARAAVRRAERQRDLAVAAHGPGVGAADPRIGGHDGRGADEPGETDDTEYATDDSTDSEDVPMRTTLLAVPPARVRGEVDWMSADLRAVFEEKVMTDPSWRELG